MTDKIELPSFLYDFYLQAERIAPHIISYCKREKCSITAHEIHEVADEFLKDWMLDIDNPNYELLLHETHLQIITFVTQSGISVITD